MSGFLRWNRRVEKVIAALGFLYARKRHIGFGRKRHSCTGSESRIVTHSPPPPPWPPRPAAWGGTTVRYYSTLLKQVKPARPCPNPNPNPARKCVCRWWTRTAYPSETSVGGGGALLRRRARRGGASQCPSLALPPARCASIGRAPAARAVRSGLILRCMEGVPCKAMPSPLRCPPGAATAPRRYLGWG